MRLVNADAIPYKRDIVVTERFPKFGGFNGKMVYSVTKEEIDAMPTIDATPVVRCRDCKYWDTVSGSTFAPMHHQCKVTKLMSTGTWYCASGEQKGGDT